ncbi:MAG: sugar phosphate isomerase/epimerase [Candidatus Atribacteria bacterium]|nr:sugar phosphate isomerase/epimerase [Candidatus Atribacteria bacterium]MCD6349940.1 sugar phosphate isomerase/epimerase [Candidatus Atribacteria bacterium]
MKIGFMTACLPELTLEEIASWAAKNGFEMLEVACWPKTYEKRRYAGTQHIDVENLDSESAAQIKEMLQNHGLKISSLGYYPNNLDPDLERRKFYHEHLKKVIKAASLLGVGVVGTFVGRDPRMNVEEALEEYKKVFPDLVKFAEDHGVRLAIENCPMLYTIDRWPGGTNLATTPEIWERMFEMIPSDYLGLNLDPSHLIWQQIDYVKVVYDFRKKIFHTHAKDTKILKDRLNQVGIFGFGWYVDKVAGTGDIDWKSFIRALYDVGYDYVVSIEHEDRSFEKDTESKLRGILLAKQLLKPYLV